MLKYFEGAMRLIRKLRTLTNALTRFRSFSCLCEFCLKFVADMLLRPRLLTSHCLMELNPSTVVL